VALALSNADINLTAAVQTVVQVAPTAQLTVLAATASNLDTVSHWVTIWRVGNGGLPSSATICGAEETPIAAGATIEIPISGQTLIDQQSFIAATDVDDMVNLNCSFASIT
jgi:hypothetical protein